VGCQVWGVLNVTPDSFSDGGLYSDLDAAVERARVMLREGVDVIDVGGASSRPRGVLYGQGAEPVGLDEELARTVPVVRELVTRLGARVSIDTVRAEVAAACLEAGASIVNDVSCGQSAALLEVAARGAAGLVLMHSRGDGAVTPPHTDYQDLLAEVRDELGMAAQRAQLQGVARERIWIDPGLGFAKTAAQSLELLAGLQALVATGLPVLVGASRKGFIGQTAPDPNGAVPGPTERAGGTAAAVTAAVLAGAAAVRVHDVALMRQAVLVARAIRQRTATAGAAA